MCIIVLDSIYKYNVVLLFAVYKSLYDIAKLNKLQQNKRRDTVKVPWQRVKHTYHEHWHIFTVLYF